VAVLEAMKMELALKAPFAGTVASVSATAGQQVELGTELLRVLREGSAELLDAGSIGSGPLDNEPLDGGPVESRPLDSEPVTPGPASGAGP
jgi:pyruvate/2-oxoglutarate dehydrogenase complex dihydrolipoamide acyltransferase (E2) component